MYKSKLRSHVFYAFGLLLAFGALTFIWSLDAILGDKNDDAKHFERLFYEHVE